MNNPTIELLFPTPVMRNSMDRGFTVEELQAVEEHSKATYQNRGNTTSNNNYILEEEVFAGLKQICLDHVKEYVKSVYSPKTNVTPYITQSWLNWTKPGEYHHEHAHPNSFVSGVLYINAGEEDKIKFFKSVYPQIKIETDNYTIFNSDSWWFGVKTLDIVLFPSSLIHNVETVTAKETRVSLAFNTFLNGFLGDNKELTELKL
jgi:uncharacterized protein (TIGR02466 family)